MVAGVVAPAWATGPTSSAIGLGSRLAGVATHPNALGPLAVALVVLEWTRRPRQPLALAAALAVVVWAQSKTSWAALALVVVLLGARHLGRLAPSRALLARAVLAGVLLVTAAIAFGLASPERSTAKGQDTTETFTGRTAIWEVTVEVWEAHPVFGVGPRLWDDAMDRRFASRVGFAPGHAHSQLIHTLGESGLVGATALVVALFAICSLAGRGDDASRGATTSLFVLLAVTGFSEPPMRSVPFSTGFFLVIATLVLCLAAADA
jgi:O-antigen ligase